MKSNTQFKPGELYAYIEPSDKVAFVLCVTDYPTCSEYKFSGIVVLVNDELCGHSIGQHDNDWWTGAPFELLDTKTLIKLTELLRSYK